MVCGLFYAFMMYIENFEFSVLVCFSLRMPRRFRYWLLGYFSCFWYHGSSQEVSIPVKWEFLWCEKFPGGHRSG